MKQIPLTQNKVALVDDEDFERLNQHKWYAVRKRQAWYAQRSISRINGKQKNILMHREIMDAPEGIQIDHRNGDGLFNCKENLRSATHAQNMHNRKHPHKNNKLRIKGVRWRERAKKFEAQIKVNNKMIYLGSFNVLGDADSAYRRAEEKYFGEFARVV